MGCSCFTKFLGSSWVQQWEWLVLLAVPTWQSWGTEEEEATESSSLDVGALCSSRDMATALGTQHPLWYNAKSFPLCRPAESCLCFGYVQSLGCLHSAAIKIQLNRETIIIPCICNFHVFAWVMGSRRTQTQFYSLKFAVSWRWFWKL